MTTEVAFLRAVNVGGHAPIKMADLKRVFASAGCKNVRSYIQSGNVIFEAPRGARAAIRRELEKRLAKLAGEQVAVAYRTLRELRQAADAAPFATFAAKGDSKWYVGFLVAPSKVRPELPLSFPKEGLEFVGMTKTEVFVVSRRVKNLYGFPNLAIEKELGVPATTRNWNTVTKIIALAGAESAG